MADLLWVMFTFPHTGKMLMVKCLKVGLLWHLSSSSDADTSGLLL